MALVKAIVILPLPHQLWGFLDLLNKLRNDIAHELEPELKKHLEIVRAMTEPTNKDRGSATESEPSETDEGRLSSLISFWLGLLGAEDSVLQLMKRPANSLRHILAFESQLFWVGSSGASSAAGCFNWRRFLD